ncbi:hypothetical protein GCM10008965_34370 [Methylorubrum aminovorans]
MRGSRLLGTNSDVQASPDVHDLCGSVTRRLDAPQMPESQFHNGSYSLGGAAPPTQNRSFKVATRVCAGEPFC